eukprot:CAMPEP_0117496586 /NCGR_PEP_ID=MMETSP0784-20121206/20734_1 /TAXON_ID=39447 /ORGANISM="" /LENGTH=515 /DNA_ID=CAMNT_0005291563 /DNA_START=12 /DNA_END=1559 /DNA_ORIENTATION=+
MKRTSNSEQVAVDAYVQEKQVESCVEDILCALLKHKPDNPRQWLLDKLEQDLSDERDDLSETDLHKLFAVTRKITSEIVPKDTIDMVIGETKHIVNCDVVSLFVFDRRSGMLLLYASNLDTPIRLPPGKGIAGSVFNTKQTVNIHDCYQDRRFDKSIDKKSGYITRSLIAVPIVDYEGSCVGVLQAINKQPKNYAPPNNGDTEATDAASRRAVSFQRNDEKVLLHLTQHVAIAMRNAEVYREAIASNERATGLLNTIQSLSQDLGTQSLLLTITMHANKIVSAVRSTVFLVDEAHQQLWSVSTDTGEEIRIPKHAGIAGQCCCEGLVINIPDAYADNRFNQAIDKKTGFRTRSILAIPVFDDQSEIAVEACKAGARKSIPSIQQREKPKAVTKPKGKQVIGVIQMINKVSYDGQLDFFDDSDIEVMEMFAKFVGPKLTHSAMLKKKGNASSEKAEAEIGLGKQPTSLIGADADGSALHALQVPGVSQHSRSSATTIEGVIPEAPIKEDDDEDAEA